MRAAAHASPAVAARPRHPAADRAPSRRLAIVLDQRQSREHICLRCRMVRQRADDRDLQRLDVRRDRDIHRRRRVIERPLKLGAELQDARGARQPRHRAPQIAASLTGSCQPDGVVPQLASHQQQIVSRLDRRDVALGGNLRRWRRPVPAGEVLARAVVAEPEVRATTLTLVPETSASLLAATFGFCADRARSPVMRGDPRRLCGLSASGPGLAPNPRGFPLPSPGFPQERRGTVRLRHWRAWAQHRATETVFREFDGLPRDRKRFGAANILRFNHVGNVTDARHRIAFGGIDAVLRMQFMYSALNSPDLEVPNLALIRAPGVIILSTTVLWIGIVSRYTECGIVR